MTPQHQIHHVRERGYVERPVRVERIVNAIKASPGLEFVALSPTIAIQSTRLPGDPPSDPADRMLIATAREMEARLVTRDRKLIDYAAGGHLAIVDATP